MTAPPCVVCSRPTADGFACAADARSLAESLTVAAGLAEDAESGAGRQARSGGGARGGSGDGLTYDATRSAQLDAVRLAVDGWVSDLLSGEPFPAWRRAGGPPCPTGVRCAHPSCAAVRVTMPPTMLAQEFAWLAAHVDRLRKHPAADEAFRELTAACDQLARLVDSPGDKVLVGMCDCGKVLYAPHGKTAITCPVPTCKLHWNVEESRDILRKALDDKLVSVAHAARLGAYLDSDRTQDNIGKLIDSRVLSGQLVAHGEIDGEPTYRFGEVILMLATIPKRKRSQRPAEHAEPAT